MRKTVRWLSLLLCFVPLATNGSNFPEITPAPGQVDPYKTRFELLVDATKLMGVSTPEQAASIWDATKLMGVSTPEQAASIWGKGLVERSAAMQFVVMTDRLKKQYAEQLDVLRSNWVTGMSSPWVANYTFTEVRKTDDTHAQIGLKIEVTASYFRASKYYDAKLWLLCEDDFWRIDRIWTEKKLYEYTLYQQ